MTKLETIIQELCPDGVEHKTICEIAIDIFRGAGLPVSRNKKGNPLYPIWRHLYDLWDMVHKCVFHTDITQITNKKYFEHGDILCAITGESVEEIAKSCAYVRHERCMAGGDIVV